MERNYGQDARATLAGAHVAPGLNVSRTVDPQNFGSASLCRPAEP